jgi:MFS transporter, PPP family, 3-phenylpropionic acid transporter
MSGHKTHRALASFYFWYFVAVAAMGPYWPSYLYAQQFSASDIGILVALSQVVRIFAPSVWASGADRCGSRVRAIRWACAFATVAFSLFLVVQGFTAYAVVTLLYSLCWHGALPLGEALTMSHLAQTPHRYGHIRLWGSLGFILGVIALGYGVAHISAQFVPYFMLMGLLICLISAGMLRDAPLDKHSHTNTEDTSLFRALMQPGVVSFLMGCLLMQASHAAFNSYFTLYLDRHGYSAPAISFYWVVGVVAEIWVFMRLPQWLQRWSAGSLWIFAMFVTALRWWAMVYWVEQPVVLFGLQTLHGASFGLFHAIAVQQIREWFFGSLQAKGQALYSSIGYGIGIGVGSLVSGFIWDHIAPSAIYAVAAVMALGGGLCAIYTFIFARRARV